MEPHNPDGELSEKEYTTFEYTIDEYITVGNITIDGDKVSCVEVFDTCLFNVDEINSLRKFLDIAEEKMGEKMKNAV